MAKIGEAFVTIGTNLSPLEQGLAKAKTATGIAGADMERDFGRVTSSVERLGQTLEHAFKWVVLYEGMREALGGIRKLIDAGLEFDKTMETARIALASAYLQNLDFGKSFGHAFEGTQKLNAALELTDKTIHRLRYDNLQTAVTFQELLTAYEGALPAGLKLGMNPEQIEAVTLRMMQAATAMHWPVQMMGAELRELFLGTVRSTSPLRALFSLEDIQKARGNAQAMHDMIMKNTEAFRTTGKMVENSFVGIWSNLKSMFSEAAGRGLADSLFHPLENEMLKWQHMIFRVDEKTKSIHFSPQFIHDFEQIGRLAMYTVRGIEAMIPPMLRLVSATATFVHNLATGLSYMHKAFTATTSSSNFLENPTVRGYAAMRAGAQSGSRADIEKALKHDSDLIDQLKAKIDNSERFGWLQGPLTRYYEHIVSEIQGRMKVLQGLLPKPAETVQEAAAPKNLPFVYWPAAEKSALEPPKHAGAGHARPFGLTEANYSVQTAESDFRRMYKELQDQQYELKMALAKSAGNVLGAEQLEQAKTLHDTLARIADESNKAKTAIMRLQAELAKRHPTPEAQGLLEKEIAREKELLTIDHQRAQIAQKIYDIHVQDLAKTHGLSGQIALAQLGVDMAGISGTRQGQLQAEYNLLRLQDLQKLAGIDRSVPGLYQAQQALSTEEEKQKYTEAYGSVGQNFMMQLSDEMRNMSSNVETASRFLQVFNQALDQVSTTVWQVISNYERMDTFAGGKELQQKLKQLGFGIANEIGEALTKTFLQRYILGPILGLFGLGNSQNVGSMTVTAGVVNVNGGVMGAASALSGASGLTGFLSKLPLIGSLFGGGVASSSSVISGLGGMGILTAGLNPMAAFASGGITDKPAIFGENGPEAAVPLPGGRSIPVNLKGAGAAKIEQNIHITVQQNKGTTQEAREYGREVGRAFNAAFDQRLAHQLRQGGMLNSNSKYKS